MEDNIYTIEDAARYLKLAVITIRRLIDRGEIKASKVGRRWRIKKNDIDEYLQKSQNIRHESSIDLTKTMIQKALWNMYKSTGDESYKDLYSKWHDNYDDITITGL